MVTAIKTEDEKDRLLKMRKSAQVWKPYLVALGITRGWVPVQGNISGSSCNGFRVSWCKQETTGGGDFRTDEVLLLNCGMRRTSETDATPQHRHCLIWIHSLSYLRL